MVRQGLGTRLLTLTLDPGKLRGLLCTVITRKARQASKVAQEEEVEEAFIMILLCQTDDFLSQPFDFIRSFSGLPFHFTRKLTEFPEFPPVSNPPFYCLKEREHVYSSHLSWSV